MKKFTFFAASLLIMASCTGNSEKAQESSDNQKDSIVLMQDSAKAEAAAEQARQDSLEMAKKQAEMQDQLSITDFCHWDNEDKLMTTNDPEIVATKLKKLGFKALSDKVTDQGIDDCTGSAYKNHEVTLERDRYGYNVFVKLEYEEYKKTNFLSEVEIIFPSSEIKDAFVKSATDNHFKKKGANEYIGHPEDIYWKGSFFKVEGNKIEIGEMTEC